MSVVPYNNEILYHDPNHGVLVVRNNKEISVSLLSKGASNQYGSISLNNSANVGSRRDKTRYSNGNINAGNQAHTCPNCGFGWTERRRSSEHPDLSSDSNAFYKGSGFPQGFMHHDYFKLLSRLPSSSAEKDTYNALPSEIFNQGYFQRFFKKVPPYTLGSGANAQVYKVVHVLNEIKLGTYAVKRISIGDKFEFLEHVLNEVFILYELSVKGANENNLIRYNHVWLELGGIDDSNTFFLPNEESSTGDTDKKVPYVFILQQYCGGGNLEELISRNFKVESKLSWEERVNLEKHKRRSKRGKEEEVKTRKWLSNFETWKFFRDVANGVNYLHVNGILHRDLKPSNCLLDSVYDPEVCGNVELFDNFTQLRNAQLKLPKVLVSDFGEGKFLSKHDLPSAENISISMLKEQDERQGNTGTLEFTAPELWLFASYDPLLEVDFNGKKFINDFSCESDVYSLGLILCYLCVGTLPFSDVITGETDPQLVRTKIMTWYFRLTAKSFNQWFFESVDNSRLQDESSKQCLQVFEQLIYMMIKGDDSVTPSQDNSAGRNRVRAAEVLETLDSMQERFVFPDPLQQYNFGNISTQGETESIDPINDSKEGQIRKELSDMLLGADLQGEVLSDNELTDEDPGDDISTIGSTLNLYTQPGLQFKSEPVIEPASIIRTDQVLLACLVCFYFTLEVSSYNSTERSIFNTFGKILSVSSIIACLATEISLPAKSSLVAITFTVCLFRIFGTL